ncbi:class I SAM-dependent DNA methyltransferase [Marinomonas profundimaris]|uniref:site-specific DNA-methyltransferase (adenine-specific) n=1 Tax=Marinomonas profundimaris TaxID=1208321 RepID=W1RP27_9GAMM|nr:DNA methyltransferase [Marinomonas profundimaris]ETI58055.1 lactate dehydrogenase [Marinomonas profundimaris]
MNPVEIEAAISELAEQPFDAANFPYEFLAAFGNKETTIKRLQSGNTNASDIENAVLQRSHIHIQVCAKNTVTASLEKLKNSKATTKAKAKFILATDGINLEAEDINSGETIACAYSKLSDHFGFFLPLAGISTVKQIRESAFDIKATGRLNKLYIELLKNNPEWGTEERSHDLNHFMARLIFCFFSEDTQIFNGDDLFTATISQMSASDSSDTHEVISEIFRAMNTKLDHREKESIRSWANGFPYVNGGLFSGSVDVPKFSKIARSYLLHVGNLDWKQINPDIFGSMIQAVADDEERGSLGMHYTSVPNILKVLNPLFLDDLRAQLDEAGDNPRRLLNLRKRISTIRVFDPACGSGNFLVIAYKHMREIEAEINKRRGEADSPTSIHITNFRGIEINDFPAEIARLALIIAEYQCDVLYRGQKLALMTFLPLDSENWITNGNALEIDWLSVCPATGTKVDIIGDDLFAVDQDQSNIDFKNEGGETYICGNPPYLGSTWQSKEQKVDLERIFNGKTKNWKSLDYVAGWFMKAAEYGQKTKTSCAFVSTNSICQGQQVPILWPLIFETGYEINFAHTSFKWANLASYNAGVSVIVVGLAIKANQKMIYETNNANITKVRKVNHINSYLLNAKSIFIDAAKRPISFDAHITDGSGALDGGFLILNKDAKDRLMSSSFGKYALFIKPYLGSSEFIRGNQRWCLWIEDSQVELAISNDEIGQRIKNVLEFRINAGTRAKTAVARPHKFAWINKKHGRQIIIPTVFSERRKYLTAGYLSEDYVISNAASIVQNAPVHIFAIISSTLHMSWVKAIAGKLKTDLRYTSATCYNNFPIPELTVKNKTDLTRCAEDILLAREAHFPATIADLYDPEKMPENLRRAHDRNDEVLERIYIGRQFKNDTERLEKLFDLYTKMTSKQAKSKTKKKDA